MTGLLSRSVHLLENLLGESLLDLPEVNGKTGLLDTTSLGLGEGLDVPIHGVLMRNKVSIELFIAKTKIMSLRELVLTEQSIGW